VPDTRTRTQSSGLITLLTDLREPPRAALLLLGRPSRRVSLNPTLFRFRPRCRSYFVTLKYAESIISPSSRVTFTFQQLPGVTIRKSAL
jgi:hypothetical protein